MGCTCGLLLLILLPFSTGQLSDLVKGLGSYKNLTVGAVGVKQYAGHLSNALNYMKREAIDKHLDNSEKDVLDKLSSGLIQVQKALVKAARGVAEIKGNANALFHMLNLYTIKTEQEKVEMAMQLFLALSKDSKAEVKEFEDGLLQAKRTLQNSQIALRTILQRLYQLREDKKADKETTQNMHIAAMAVKAALGAVGVVFGLPLAPVSVLFGIHGYSMMEEHSNFLEQEGEIKDRIDGYETISMKTDAVCEGVDAKIKQVQEVYTKLSTTGRVADAVCEGVDAKIKQVQEVYAKLSTTGRVAVEQLPNPQAQCEFLQQLSGTLVKACDTFLKEE